MQERLGLLGLIEPDSLQRGSPFSRAANLAVQ